MIRFKSQSAKHFSSFSLKQPKGYMYKTLSYRKTIHYTRLNFKLSHAHFCTQSILGMFQCVFDYVLSVSYQVFELIIIWLLPLLFATSLLLAVAGRVQQRIHLHGCQPGMQLSDADNRQSHLTTYSARMQRLQVWLGLLPRRGTRRRRRPVDSVTEVSPVGRLAKVTDPCQEGYGSDSSSDEEIGLSTKQSALKRSLKFRRSEYIYVFTYLLCMWLYFVCWLPVATVHLIDTSNVFVKVSISAAKYNLHLQQNKQSMVRRETSENPKRLSSFLMLILVEVNYSQNGISNTIDNFKNSHRDQNKAFLLTEVEVWYLLL